MRHVAQPVLELHKEGLHVPRHRHGERVAERPAVRRKCTRIRHVQLVGAALQGHAEVGDGNCVAARLWRLPLHAVRAVALVLDARTYRRCAPDRNEERVSTDLAFAAGKVVRIDKEIYWQSRRRLDDTLAMHLALDGTSVLWLFGHLPAVGLNCPERALARWLNNRRRRNDLLV